MKNYEEEQVLFMEKRKLWVQITKIDSYNFEGWIMSEIRPFEWEGTIWTADFNHAMKFRGMKQLSSQIRRSFSKKVNERG